MESLEFNVWDIQNIDKKISDKTIITNDLLIKNGFTKGGMDDRLMIFKNNRDWRCDILWENLDLKTVKDLRDLNKKLFRNMQDS